MTISSELYEVQYQCDMPSPNTYPNVKVKILIRNTFNIESDGRYSRNDFAYLLTVSIWRGSDIVWTHRPRAGEPLVCTTE